MTDDSEPAENQHADDIDDEFDFGNDSPERLDPERTDSDPDDNVPLSDLAGRVAERRSRSAATKTDSDELFESVRVEELDSDDVWTSLVDSGDDDASVGAGADAEPVDATDSVLDHIVPKATFCQRCEHFAGPPELGCSHDGTAIVEVVDTEHFRVRNCPMVDPEDD
ncbi:MULTISPECIES: hypothetical protein [Haloferax]|uniref:DUF8135 domain-containing protein n=2 Tax=Haloferax TaxID=2251 RepID=A0A6G1Z2D6_9EURY|nr:MULTISPECIES: hypothetical protein [Haloferax]KAB1187976.1 hypothetical protein Hfx1149_08000 [Haloferax sp. CBA1149]MRW80645.1 hypothetical protein [Haloferax marinisediminis]